MAKQEEQPKNPVVIPEKIHIANIKLVTAQIESTREKLESNEEFELSFETSSNFNIANNYCKIIFTVIFFKDGKSKEEQINAKFTFQYDFLVDNLSDFFIDANMEKTQYTMNAVLGIALMSIVYSTSRGIILTRTAGTVLDAVLLPVIDVSNLIKQDDGKTLK